MSTQLLELRKTLAKQAETWRIKKEYYQDAISHESPFALSFYGYAAYYNFHKGAYEASRKAWWTVVEMMRDA